MIFRWAARRALLLQILGLVLLVIAIGWLLLLLLIDFGQ